MKIPITELRQKVVAILKQNFTEDQADSIADYLIWADMSGIKTQGVIKLTGTTPLQNVKPTGEIKGDRDTKLSRLIDAGAYPAPLVSQQATEVVIQKAKEHGFGIVEDSWGSLFIAIDPEILVDVEKFKSDCSELVAKVKSSRRKPGVDEIRLPGERAKTAYKEAEASGMVEVDDAILKELGY